MNNYQTQQFWNDISSVIGFATSVMVVVFMVGAVKLISPTAPILIKQGKSQLFSGGKKREIANYELTSKGEKYFLGEYKPEERLSELEEEAFHNVISQRITFRFGIKEVEAVLPRLERKGYIKYVVYSMPDLIERISLPDFRDEITVYYRIAKELPVSDEQVNELYNIYKLRVEEVAEYFQVVPREVRRRYQSTLSLVRDAKTRSDKIIAIDAMVTLQHEEAEMLAWLHPEARLDDCLVARRILGLLAE